MGKYDQDIFGAARFNRTGTGALSPAVDGIPGKRIVVEGMSVLGTGASDGINVVRETGGSVIARCGGDSAISGMFACGAAGDGIAVTAESGSPPWHIWGRIVSDQEPVLVNYDPTDATLIP